jgi:hypothetical protein
VAGSGSLRIQCCSRNLYTMLATGRTLHPSSVPPSALFHLTFSRCSSVESVPFPFSRIASRFYRGNAQPVPRWAGVGGRGGVRLRERQACVCVGRNVLKCRCCHNRRCGPRRGSRRRCRLRCRHRDCCSRLCPSRVFATFRSKALCDLSIATIARS